LDAENFPTNKWALFPGGNSKLPQGKFDFSIWACFHAIETRLGGFTTKCREIQAFSQFPTFDVLTHLAGKAINWDGGQTLYSLPSSAFVREPVISGSCLIGSQASNSDASARIRNDYISTAGSEMLCQCWY
jgi:hypothetical protein